MRHGVAAVVVRLRRGDLGARVARDHLHATAEMRPARSGWAVHTHHEGVPRASGRSQAIVCVYIRALWYYLRNYGARWIQTRDEWLVVHGKRALKQRR